jgi:hypothetical protein
MSVHWKQKASVQRPHSEMELARAEARQRLIKEQKQAAFRAKVEAGFDKIISILDNGGMVVRSERDVIDLNLWKSINREVIRAIKGEDGYRFLWDDQGFMAEGPGHCIRKVDTAKAA